MLSLVVQNGRWLSTSLPKQCEFLEHFQTVEYVWRRWVKDCLPTLLLKCAVLGSIIMWSPFSLPPSLLTPLTQLESMSLLRWRMTLQLCEWTHQVQRSFSFREHAFQRVCMWTCMSSILIRYMAHCTVYRKWDGEIYWSVLSHSHSYSFSLTHTNTHAHSHTRTHTHTHIL